MSDCKCQHPCNPCNKNCPDDKITVIRDTIDVSEPLEVELLDADECSGPCWGCWCWGWCKDNCGINIQSTNECLEVDTSECGVVKLTATCPPVVVAWNNITVDTEPCDENEHCSIKYIVNAECEDEKVKACSWDTTPWYLNQKLVAWDWINIESVWCDWWDAHLVISADNCPEFKYPVLELEWSSQLIDLSIWWPHWHTIYYGDRAQQTYYNMVCIWFKNNKDTSVRMDDVWNAVSITRVDDVSWWWDMYTWNWEMATSQWILIRESWYYRVFWQLTVENNIWVPADQYYINLWRAFLRIWRNGQEIYLSTAKHWAYWRQVLFTWWSGISISSDWEIASTWWTFRWSWTAPEWGWTVTVSGSITPGAWWGTQTKEWFDWPWMTFNIDAYVDLYRWDIVSLWYRPQSDMEASRNQTAHFRFTWANDSSTEFERVFWWSMLWANLVAAHLFQSWESNKIYWNIYL